METTTWVATDQVASAADEKRARMHTLLRDLGSVLVAFSAGTDSTYLLYEAHEVLGDGCVAAIAVSPSLPQADLERARTLAASIGVRLIEVATHEMENPQYVRNAPDRCYFCKKELFTELEPLARREGLRHIVYGAMADDLRDHRPGARAAAEFAVRAPLQEAQLGKDEIRFLSHQAGLPTWDLPSQACLSSRVAYGLPIDAAWLRNIEEAEQCIRSLGARQVRVRHHGRLARIEVEPKDIPLLVENRKLILEHLRRLGYIHVTMDLAGFRSGSMNLGV